MRQAATSEVSLGPEIELLVVCARTSMDAATTARVRELLRQDLDWKALLRAGRQHGVRPLLYRNLKSIAPEAVPTDVWSQLGAYFSYKSQLNLRLAEALLGVLKTFAAEAIPAVPFKGPTLAALLYGNLALRPFWDLDILVHERDVPRARDLLVEHGYLPRVRLGRNHESAYLRSHWELKCVRDADDTVVDLHWRFTPDYFSFAFDTDRLWDRLASVCLQGERVPTLAPDDLLLILCVHGATHSWERLQWICDVAELVRLHQTFDWDEVIEGARRLGGARMLLLGLVLARNLLGARLPDEVGHAIRADRRVEKIATGVRARMASRAAGSPSVSESALFHLSVRERLRDRLRYSLRFALTPTARDWALLPRPAPLSLVYFLLRPLRLLRKYALGRDRT